MHTILRLAMTA